MAASRRREQAVVTGITAEHHNHDYGHIADQTDAPPPQAASERAGRHHRAHAQRQRAERETDAAHHRSALQQLGDASAQQQSQGRPGERADEGRRQGAAAAQQRLGDGEHHQQRDRNPMKLTKVYTLNRNSMRMDNKICFILYVFLFCFHNLCRINACSLIHLP